MRNDVEDLNYKLNKISQDISNIEDEQYKLEGKIYEMEDQFCQKDKVFQELHDIWKTGEMSYIMQDIEWEIKQNQHMIVNELEKEKESLKQKKRALENKEEELYFERRRRTL